MIPNKAQFEVTILWSQEYRYANIAFFSKEVGSYTGRGITVAFARNNVQLHRRGRGAHNRVGYATIAPVEGKAETYRFSLDLVNGRGVIALNDRKLAEFNDVALAEGKAGTSLVLTGLHGTTTFSGISRLGWDETRLEEGEEEIEQDTIRFLNADQMTGALAGIDGGHVKLGTEFGELEISMERVEQLVTNPKRRHLARRNKSDLIAHLQAGGFLTLAVDRLENGILYGSSENPGQVEVSQQALSGVRLRVNDPRHRPKKQKVVTQDFPLHGFGEFDPLDIGSITDMEWPCLGLGFAKAAMKSNRVDFLGGPWG